MSQAQTPLSSPWTLALKLLPLLLWLFVLGTAVYDVATHSEDRGSQILWFIVFTPILALMFFSYWKLMDRVAIVGNELELVRRGIRQRLPLSDVLNVAPGRIQASNIVWIRLRNAGPFGEEVKFASRWATTTMWSTRLSSVESLIHAVDAAKTGLRA